jgi:hypothetical protein
MTTKLKRKAHTDDLRAFLDKGGQVINFRQIVAYIMFKSGCTFQEIADVLGFNSRQQAQIYVNAYIKKIDSPRDEERN